MLPQYWLVKTEPETYSYQDLVKEKETCWDGIRNFEARNYLRQMKKGDLSFIYHTGKERAIIGIGEVTTKAAYPDPNILDGKGDWSAIRLKAKTKLKRPVSLYSLRKDAIFKNCLLLHRSRLSVMPFSDTEFFHIIKLSEWE